MVIKYPESVTSCVYGVSGVTDGDWGLSFLIPGSAGAVPLRRHAAQFGFGRVDLQDRHMVGLRPLPNEKLLGI